MKLEFHTDGTPQTIEQVLDYKVDIAFITGNPKHTLESQGTEGNPMTIAGNPRAIAEISGSCRKS